MVSCQLNILFGVIFSGCVVHKEDSVVRVLGVGF